MKEGDNMIRKLTVKKPTSLTLNFKKKYVNLADTVILDDWMMKELEETIDRINKGEEELIPFEEWQEEMRREYNVNF